MNKKIIVSTLILFVGCSPSAGKNIPHEEKAEQAALRAPEQGEEKNTAEKLEEESGALSLAKALALTLRRSPELESFSYNLRAGESRILQAGLLPNPEISLGVEDVLGSGEYSDGKQAQSTLLLSQLIELGGKRAAREELAQAHQSQMEGEYQIKKVEVLSELSEKFLRTLADEKLYELARRAKVLAENALKNIQQRALAGGVSELEESKAKVLLARSQIAAEHAEHELATSKRELASLWGSDAVHFSKLEADIFHSDELPQLEDLEESLDQSLRTKQWMTEKRLRKAEEELALAKRVPNFTFAAGPRRLEGENAESWVFQVSMPLQIFDRNQGGISEARTTRGKTLLEEKRSKLRLRTVLFGLYQELKHALTEMDAMKKYIVPEAEKSLKAAESGYQQGRFSYLELLDTQRTLLEVYREHIEAAHSSHHFRNAIENLLGASLPSRTASK